MTIIKGISDKFHEGGVLAPVETEFAKGTRQKTELNRQMSTVFGVCAEIFQSKTLITTVLSRLT